LPAALDQNHSINKSGNELSQEQNDHRLYYKVLRVKNFSLEPALDFIKRRDNSEEKAEEEEGKSEDT
jgi:hypothetical protein